MAINAHLWLQKQHSAGGILLDTAPLTLATRCSRNLNQSMENKSTSRTNSAKHADSTAVTVLLPPISHAVDPAKPLEGQFRQLRARTSHVVKALCNCCSATPFIPASLPGHCRRRRSRDHGRPWPAAQWWRGTWARSRRLRCGRWRHAQPRPPHGPPGRATR